MKRFNTIPFIFWIALFAFLPLSRNIPVISLYAQEKGEPPRGLFSPDSEIQEMNLHSSSGKLDDVKFIYYALKFSGLEPENTGKYLAVYESIAADFSDAFGLEAGSRDLPEKMDSQYALGESLLAFLHDTVLRKYSETETRLDVLLDKGLFNCVSSGVIYYALASRFDLNVNGVRTNDHAFCSLEIGNSVIDVETTTKHGFDPGEKKEFLNSFGETGFVYTPPSNYRDRRNIGAKEFLSLILQNRISLLQHRGNYTSTVPLAVDRHALLGNSESYRDLVNEFKNHAVQLGNNRQYSTAVTFLSDAAEAYGSHYVISDTAGKLFYNQVVLFLEKDLVSDASDFFDRFSGLSLIDNSIRTEAEKIINEKKLYLYIMKNSFEPSRESIINYHDKGFIGSSIRKEYLVFVFSREIQRVSEKSLWEDALELAKRGMAEADNDPRLLKLKNTVEYNIGVLYHNRFASHYNSGELAEALSVIREGLSVVPDNRTLLSDLDLLNKK